MSEANNEKRFQKISPNDKKNYGVVSLAIRPNLSESQYGQGGLTGKQLQEKFDALANLVIDRYNDVVGTLGSEAATQYIELPDSLKGRIPELSLYEILSKTFDKDGNISVKYPMTDNDGKPINKIMPLNEAIVALAAYKIATEKALHDLVTSEAYRADLVGDTGAPGKDGRDGATGLQGNGIASIVPTFTGADGDYNTVVINFTDTNMLPVTLKIKNGTKGADGKDGKPFKIVRFYDSVDAMENDADPIEVNSYCMIRNEDVAENGHLYMRDEDSDKGRVYQYIADMDNGVPVDGKDGVGIHDINVSPSSVSGEASEISVFLDNNKEKPAKTFYVYNGKDGNGIKSVDVKDVKDDNNNVIGQTVTLYYTKTEDTDSFTVLNGKDGATVSDIQQKKEDGVNTITFTLSNGEEKKVTILDGAPGTNGTNGTNGKDGEAFKIYASYNSVDDMNSDIDNIPEGAFVFIDATNDEDPYDATLWTKVKDNGTDGYKMSKIGSLKGATGIQGPSGKNGVGISEIGWVTNPLGKGHLLNIYTKTVGSDEKPTLSSFPVYDGAEGVGIKSVEQFEKSSTDGGENTIRFHLTNGNSYDVYIRNGSNVIYADNGSPGIWYTMMYDSIPYAVCWAYGLCSEEDIEIAERANLAPVTEISDNAFQNEDIKSVIIPKSIKKIGDYAFDGCTQLMSVEMDSTRYDGAPIVNTIGKNAFSNCTSLPEIRIPNSVSMIGQGAFDNCSSLKTIKFHSNTAFEGLPFNGCEKLENFSIEDNGAGKYYTDNFAIYENDTNYSPISLFRYAIGNQSPTYTVDERTYTIKSYAFYGAKYLEKIYLNNAATLEESAFEGCSKLTKIKLPGTREEGMDIPQRAFKDCASLGSVIIPTTVKRIGKDAFAGCNSLEKVYYEGNVAEWNALTTNIADGNDYLTNATIYYYSEELPQINGDWWHYINGEVTEYGDLDVKITLKLNNDGRSYYVYRGEVLIGEETDAKISDVNPADGYPITRIGESAFIDTEITSVTFGANITSIGRQAFAGCSKLTSVNIKDNVKEISRMAFYNCTGLTTVNIGSGVNSIGERAFEDCPNLTHIEVNENNPDFASFNINKPLGDGSYETIGKALISKDKTHWVKFPEGINSLTTLTIPEGVTHIDEYACSQSNITELNLPYTLIVIGDGAFYGCNKLKRLKMYDNVTDIKQFAFSNKMLLEQFYYYGTEDDFNEITIGNGNTALTKTVSIASIFSALGSANLLTYIIDYANNREVAVLKSAKNIDPSLLADRTVVIPSEYGGRTVIGIADAAFQDCKTVKKVKIPNTLEYIGATAFNNCPELEDVVFDAEYSDQGGALADKVNLTSIGQYAFANSPKFKSNNIFCKVEKIEAHTCDGCTALTDFKASKATEIGAYAFRNSGITSVKNLSRATTFGDRAFQGCQGLTEVHARQVTGIGAWAFANCTSLTTVDISDANDNYNKTCTLGVGAFAECGALSSVKLADETDVGIEAFIGCRSLTTLPTYKPFEGKEAIYERAFQNCGFTSLNIPEGIITLGIECFQFNQSLGEIIIPTSVKLIRQRAFAGCVTPDGEGGYKRSKVYYRGKKKEWENIDIEGSENASFFDDNVEFKYDEEG